MVRLCCCTVMVIDAPISLLCCSFAFALWIGFSYFVLWRTHIIVFCVRVDTTYLRDLCERKKAIKERGKSISTGFTYLLKIKAVQDRSRHKMGGRAWFSTMLLHSRMSHYYTKLARNNDQRLIVCAYIAYL